MLVEEFSDNSLIMVMETIGVRAWVVALVAAGIALVRQAGASWLVPVVLALSAVPTAWHVFPFGQIGLALFIGALWLVLRTESSARAPAPLGQPGSA